VPKTGAYQARQGAAWGCKALKHSVRVTKPPESARKTP